MLGYVIFPHGILEQDVATLDDCTIAARDLHALGTPINGRHPINSYLPFSRWEVKRGLAPNPSTAKTIAWNSSGSEDSI